MIWRSLTTKDRSRTLNIVAMDVLVVAKSGLDGSMVSITASRFFFSRARTLSLITANTAAWRVAFLANWIASGDWGGVGGVGVSVEIFSDGGRGDCGRSFPAGSMGEMDDLAA